METAPDRVDALLFWAIPALTSAERVLRNDEGFSPWRTGRGAPRNREQIADAALMVLALRNVHRAAAWVARETQGTTDDDLGELVGQFDAYLPGLIHARDALEHFDEYALGQGRLQRTQPGPYEMELLIEDGRPIVSIGPLSLDVERAREACRWLVISLLARQPIRNREDAEARLKEVMYGQGNESE